jgi:transposase-like protein
MNLANTETKTRKARRSYSAQEKAAAVLALWSGRRNPSRLARELGLNWGTLNCWSQSGLLGMLKALGGEPLPTNSQGELGRRLEGLLAALQRATKPRPEAPPATATPAATPPNPT